MTRASSSHGDLSRGTRLVATTDTGGLVATTDTGEVLPDMADATSETLHLSSGMLQQRPTAEVDIRAVCALLCNHSPPPRWGGMLAPVTGDVIWTSRFSTCYNTMVEHGKCNLEYV
jgi:hypothetical protein